MLHYYFIIKYYNVIMKGEISRIDNKYYFIDEIVNLV